MARLTAILVLAGASLMASAALACEPGAPCVYMPASPAYVMTPVAPEPPMRRGAEDRYGARDDEGRQDERESGWGRERQASGEADVERSESRGRQDHQDESRWNSHRGWAGPRYAGRRWDRSWGGGWESDREARHSEGFEGGRGPCDVCAPSPAIWSSHHYTEEARTMDAPLEEAPPMSDSFFYGGLSGGAGPGLDVGGGSGSGYEMGQSGIFAANGWSGGMAQGYASGSASAFASASAYASAHSWARGSGHVCFTCGMPPKPPHRSGCGCKHR